MKILKYVTYNWSDQTIMNMGEEQIVVFWLWVGYIAITVGHFINVIINSDDDFSIRKGSYFMIIGYIVSIIPATFLTILLINPISQTMTIFLIVLLCVFLIYSLIYAIVQNDNGTNFTGGFNIFGSFRKYSEALVEFNSKLETYTTNYKNVTNQII